MNLETFYEQFELLADAPNAVQKLREMVLQLALGGKLVEHSPRVKSDLRYARKAFSNLIGF